MKASRKAEKRQKRKEKKRKQLEAKLVEEQVKFNILKLLEEEQLDTKPNMAKFLDQYVEYIRGLVSNSKIVFYPTLQYEITKVFVKFLDSHELIYTKNVLSGSPNYYMYDGLTEVQLKEKELELIEMFFKYLLEFKFVSSTN